MQGRMRTLKNEAANNMVQGKKIIFYCTQINIEVVHKGDAIAPHSRYGIEKYMYLHNYSNLVFM